MDCLVLFFSASSLTLLRSHHPIDPSQKGKFLPPIPTNCELRTTFKSEPRHHKNRPKTSSHDLTNCEFSPSGRLPSCIDLKCRRRPQSPSEVFALEGWRRRWRVGNPAIFTFQRYHCRLTLPSLALYNISLYLIGSDWPRIDMTGRRRKCARIWRDLVPGRWLGA